METAIPNSLQLHEGVAVTFAAKAEDGVRRFEMLAYSGARVKRMFGDAIVDLAGLSLGRKKKPILRQHDSSRIVGHSEEMSVDDKGVHVSGRMSSTTKDGMEVAATSDEGFPWETSIGFEILQYARLREDESRTINGQLHKGPLIVFEKTKLREVSFVAAGADENTTGSVFSDGVAVDATPIKEIDMTEDKKTAVDPVAAFQRDHAAEVEKWQADARKAEAQATTERLGRLKSAFPDRPQFVVDQFAKGNDVPAAKAELCDVLMAEAKLSAAENAKLKEAATKATEGHPGIAFAPSGGGDAEKTDRDKIPIEQLARQDWKANFEGCNQEFASLRGYEFFLREVRRVGDAKSWGKTTGMEVSK